MHAGAPEPALTPRVTAHGVLVAVAVALPYLVRAVLSSAVEAFRAELWLTDATLGLVASVYALLLALAAPAYLALAPRGPRPRLAAAGTGLAALGTALAGLSGNFPALLAGMGVAGIGLAAGATLAPTLVAESPAAGSTGTTGRTAVRVAAGTAAGFALGSFALARLGWRMAFFGAAGLALLATLAWLRVREPAPDRAPGPFVPFAPDRVALAARALGLRPRWPLTLGAFAVLAFAASALAFWAPAFLVRVRGLPRWAATGQLAPAVLMAGVAGTLAGPPLAALLRGRAREPDRLAAGLAALAASPLLLAACVDPRPGVYLTSLVAGLALLFAAVRPACSAVLADASGLERGSAVVVALLAAQVGGDVPGPLLVGALADAGSLSRAVLAIPAAALAAGALWTWAAAQRPDGAAGGSAR